MFNRLSRMNVGGGVDIPPLVLMTLAGLTPQEHEVSIVDEEVQAIDYEGAYDLVGITLLTTTAPRGYEIADEFRARGVTVVLGGIHATVLPEEAAKHADSVVVGEAEGVWRRLLDDVKADRLQPLYKSEILCDLAGLPFARRDLVSKSRYVTTNVVQTTRGCPNRCSFCSVGLVSGNAYRYRPVREVVAEIETFSDPMTVIVDDNLIGNPRRARELFEALAPLDLRWFGQGTLEMTADEELLALAAKSGCRILLIGFESLSEGTIRAIGKARTNPVHGYREAIRKLHAHGISVVGSFILGFDGDEPSVFERTLEFIEESGIDIPLTAILTPYPGTRLFATLTKQGRIVSENWRDYSMSFGRAVFQPSRMTASQLERGQRSLTLRAYSLPALAKRMLTTRRNVLPVTAYSLHRRKALRAVLGGVAEAPSGERRLEGAEVLADPCLGPRAPESTLRLH